MPAILLRPSDIKFTQNSISGRFKDDRGLDATFGQFLRGTLTPDDLPLIDVVYKDNHWWTVTGNRRLYLYRKLEELKLVDCIKVNQRSMEDHWVRKQLTNLMTTVNCGASVYMRRSYSGIAVEINRLELEWKASRAKQTVAIDVYDTRNFSQANPSVADETVQSARRSSNLSTISSAASQKEQYALRKFGLANPYLEDETVQCTTKSFKLSTISSTASQRVQYAPRNFSQTDPYVADQTVQNSTRSSNLSTISSAASQGENYAPRHFSQANPSMASHDINYNPANTRLVGQTTKCSAKNTNQVYPIVVNFSSLRDSSNFRNSVACSEISRSGNNSKWNSSSYGERATGNSRALPSPTCDADRAISVATVVEMAIEIPDEIPVESGYLTSMFRAIYRFVTGLLRSEIHMSRPS